MSKIVIIYYLFLGICFTTTITGCKKNCYYCYAFWGAYSVSKNGDTIQSYGSIQSRTRLQDSLNYYINLGYKVDTVFSIVYPDPSIGDKVCNLNEVNYGQPTPDSCVQI